MMRREGSIEPSGQPITKWSRLEREESVYLLALEDCDALKEDKKRV